MTLTTARIFRPSFQSQKAATAPAFDPAAVFSRLGLVVGDREAMVARIRAGFPVQVIDKLSRELQLSQRDLLPVIALPAATLTRRRLQKRLSSQESDRVYRLASAYCSALQLFEGDVTAARHWLNEPAKALGGSTPLAHLDTEAGAAAIQDLIGRLETGVIS